MKCFSLIATVLLLTACAEPAPGTVQAGTKAAKAGDYETSAGIFRALADEGDAWGQYNLGFQYNHGLGVEKSHTAAIRWWRAAAGQRDVKCSEDCDRRDWPDGHALAQFGLGVIYEKNPNLPRLADNGIAQDYAEALHWYRRAGKQGLRRAKTRIPILEAKIRYADSGVPIPPSLRLGGPATRGDGRFKLQMIYSWQGVSEKSENTSGTVSVSARGNEGNLAMMLDSGGRECRGRWQRDGGRPDRIVGSFGTWFIRCVNGLAASGLYEMTTGATGFGEGKDTQGRAVTFTFGGDTR